MCLAMLLTLCACGSQEEKDLRTETENIQSSVVEPNVTENAEYALSEYLALGETIWYQIETNKGKDSKVDKIFVLEPDGSLYVADGIKYTLGEMEQMEDAEIAVMVRGAYAKEVINRAMATNLNSGLGKPTIGFDLISQGDSEEAYEDISNSLFSTASVRYILEDNIFSGKTFTMEDMLEYYSFNWNKLYVSDAVETEWDSIEAVITAWTELYAEHGASHKSDLITLAYIIYQNADFEGVKAELAYANLSADIFIESVENLYSLVVTATNNVYNNILAQIEEYQENLAPAQYYLAITTDSTGNSTASMVLAYQVTSPVMVNTYSLELHYQYPVSVDGVTTNCTTVVYDSVYGGFRCDDGFLYTRINTNAHFMLDQVGESDLPIDVKDIKTLFE